jgi:hypothetical protein
METKAGRKEMDELSEFVKKIGEGIQAKSMEKNKHLKALMAENKKDLIEMLDTSYQDAFNIDLKRKRKEK